jgi:hypothetical protein
VHTGRAQLTGIPISFSVIRVCGAQTGATPDGAIGIDCLMIHHSIDYREIQGIKNLSEFILSHRRVTESLLITLAVNRIAATHYIARFDTKATMNPTHLHVAATSSIGPTIFVRCTFV